MRRHRLFPSRVQVSPLVSYLPTWILESEVKSPNTFRSHTTTAMTTTAFTIDLMVACMGIKRSTSHRRTPTTIRAITICSKGISYRPTFLRRQTLRTVQGVTPASVFTQRTVAAGWSGKEPAISGFAQAEPVGLAFALALLPYLATILDGAKDRCLFTCDHIRRRQRSGRLRRL